MPTSPSDAQATASRKALKIYFGIYKTKPRAGECLLLVFVVEVKMESGLFGLIKINTADKKFFPYKGKTDSYPQP